MLEFSILYIIRLRLGNTVVILDPSCLGNTVVILEK